MPFELVILSGPRRNERVALDGDRLRMGCSNRDELQFDPADYPGAVGQAVLLRQQADGWTIRADQGTEVLLNSIPLKVERRLRAGDIVRFSAQGPDLLFELASAKSTSAETHGAASSASDSKVTQAGSSDSAQPHSKVATNTSKKSLPIWGTLLMVLVALVLLALAAKSFWQPNQNAALAPPPQIESASTNEGEPFSLELVNSDWLNALSAGKAQISLSQNAPLGIEIDQIAGELHWTPAEQQAGKRHQWSILFQELEGNNVVETYKRVCSVEVVRKPQPTPKPNKPDGQPDSPSQDNDSDSNDTEPVAPGKTVSEPTANIKPEPSVEPKPVIDWSPALVRLWSTVYVNLIGNSTPDKKGQAIPLGFSTAIGDHTLITSGSVAVFIHSQLQAGQPVYVFREDLLKPIEIVSVKVHQGFAENFSDREARLFFDLGLLTTKEELKNVLRVKPVSQEAIKVGMPVSIVGLKNDSKTANDLSFFKIQLVRGTLFHGIQPKGEGRTNPILFVVDTTEKPICGSLPCSGSAIVTPSGQLLGFLAESAPDAASRKQQASHLHYAPSAIAAFGWQQGKFREQWIDPPDELSTTQDGEPSN